MLKTVVVFLCSSLGLFIVLRYYLKKYLAVKWLKKNLNMDINKTTTTTTTRIIYYEWERIPSMKLFFIPAIISQMYKYTYKTFMKELNINPSLSLPLQSQSQLQSQLQMQGLTAIVKPQYINRILWKMYSKCLNLTTTTNTINNKIASIQIIPYSFFDCQLVKAQVYLFTRPEFPFRLLGAVHWKTKTRIYQLLVGNENMNEELKNNDILTVKNKKIILTSNVLPKWEYNAKKDIIFHSENNAVFIPHHINNNNIETTIEEKEKEEKKKESLFYKSKNTYLIKAPPKWRLDDVSNQDQKDELKIMKNSGKELSRSELIWKIASHTSRDFSYLSGDINPIHLYPLTAKIFGMKSNVMHGMWSVGKIVHYLLIEKFGDRIQKLISENQNMTDEWILLNLTQLMETQENAWIEVNSTFVRPLFLPAVVNVEIVRYEYMDRFNILLKDKNSGESKVCIEGSVSYRYKKNTK